MNKSDQIKELHKRTVEVATNLLLGSFLRKQDIEKCAKELTKIAQELRRIAKE